MKYVHTLMEVSANDLGRGVGDEGVDVTMMDLEKMKLVFEKIGVGAKGVEVKAILAADGAEDDPAERARADLEHLEAREREIASWRPR